MKVFLVAGSIAMLGGVLVACQAVINAHVGRTVGSIPLSGAASAAITSAILAIVLVLHGNVGVVVRGLAAVPPWMPFVGGALGAAIMGCVLWSTPRIGATSMIVLLIAGQLCFSAAADHFGLFGLRVKPLDPVRTAGMIAVFGGAWVVAIR